MLHLLLILFVLEPFITATGSVTDTQGAALSDAQVTYRRDLSADSEALRTEDQGVSQGQITADSNGRYSIKIHAGIYDVCVMVNAFTPQCRKLQIKADHPALPNFILRADPLITSLTEDTVVGTKKPRRKAGLSHELPKN